LQYITLFAGKLPAKRRMLHTDPDRVLEMFGAKMLHFNLCKTRINNENKEKSKAEDFFHDSKALASKL
jgi:hypothetical protein